MSKTFNLYCDESTHIPEDGKPYMIISYVSCPYPHMKIHMEHFKLLRDKHKFKGELKWSNISKSQYEFYSDVIDYFFSTDLSFRAVIVDKSKIDENRKGYTHSDFYFLMYYQLIYHKLNPDYKYNIYLDIKDTCSQKKLAKLGTMLNKNNNIRNLQFIKSYESYLMQLTDVLMGAINYHIRGLNKVTAKMNIIEKIKFYSNLDLTRSTAKYEKKMNLFYINLK